MELQRIKEESAELIIFAVKFTASAAMYASDCHLDLSKSLYLNIRDAMFHYKAMCDYIQKMDEDNALRHYFNLKEHLIRGEKDAITLQAMCVEESLFKLLQTEDFNQLFNPEEIKKLQFYYHKIKDVILRVRLGSSNLTSVNFIWVEEMWSELKEYTKSVGSICGEKNIYLF